MAERTDWYGSNGIIIIALIVTALVVAGYLFMDNETTMTGTNPAAPTSSTQPDTRQPNAPGGMQPQPQENPGAATPGTTTEGGGAR